MGKFQKRRFNNVSKEGLPFKRAFKLLWGLATAIALPIATWLYADVGKEWIAALKAGEVESVPVSGDSVIQQQLNLAKMLGANVSDASSEMALAVPIARPALDAATGAPGFGRDIVVLANASPVKPLRQKVVFASGSCFFIGRALLRDVKTASGSAEIFSLSCRSDSGDVYELGDEDRLAIGFLTPASAPSSHELAFIWEDKVMTLPRSGRYLLRLREPLEG